MQYLRLWDPQPLIIKVDPTLKKVFTNVEHDLLYKKWTVKLNNNKEWQNTKKNKRGWQYTKK
jgi:hypothetical protein